MNKYMVYGEEQGFIEEFETLKEAKKFVKDLKETDKRLKIDDIYQIEKEAYINGD